MILAAETRVVDGAVLASGLPRIGFGALRDIGGALRPGDPADRVHMESSGGPVRAMKGGQWLG